MLITIVPLRFSKQGIVSTAAGILNAAAYLGCAAANRAAGAILENAGWNALIAFWIVICIAAIAFCMMPSGNKKEKS